MAAIRGMKAAAMFMYDVTHCSSKHVTVGKACYRSAFSSFLITGSNTCYVKSSIAMPLKVDLVTCWWRNVGGSWLCEGCDLPLIKGVSISLSSSWNCGLCLLIRPELQQNLESGATFYHS